jgi:hypothetical protein
MSNKKNPPKPAAPKPTAPKQPAFLAEPVRSPQVFAGDCPKSPTHKQTRVYRTVGQTRYCVCDDCGHTWKQIGPAASKEA